VSQVSNRRRWWRPGLAALLALTLCGCFQTKDEFTLEADGSGRVRIETRVLISPDVLSAMNPGAHLGGEEPVVYPPLTEMDARRLFPARDFKLTVKTEKAGDDGQTVIAEASFKDVNVLLASPYARAHAMSLKIDAGQLVFQAVSGLEAAARLGEVKDDGGFLAEQTPGLKDVLKKKDELRHEFRVTLPGAVTAPAGAVAGRTVTWMAERTKHTNAAEFAQAAGMVLAARCAADGVKFTPATPTRLALGSFSDVPSGELAVRGAGPDVAKVKAAAKFVPYALQVTRALDLSGEGGGLDHQAQLFGAMVVPREFTPQKVGRGDDRRGRGREGQQPQDRGRAGCSFRHRNVRATGDRRGGGRRGQTGHAGDGRAEERHPALSAAGLEGEGDRAHQGFDGPPVPSAARSTS
jgi:hypothetical protein